MSKTGKEMIQDLYLDYDEKDLKGLCEKHNITDENLVYETIDHPLINDESPHYEMLGGVQSIELMEMMFTTEELMAWAKITAMKYRLRVGKKVGNHAEQEVNKIRTFENYYRYLEKK
jgi:hypothetical protein